MITFVTIALMLGGVRESWFYGTTVLHEHALVGTIHAWQYGIVSIFYLVCGDPETALRLGKFTLFAGVIGTFIAARYLARRFHDQAILLVLPPSAALLFYCANAEHLVAIVPALLMLNRCSLNKALIAASFAAWCPWAANGSVVACVGLPLVAYSTFRGSSRNLALGLTTLLTSSAYVYSAGIFIGSWHMYTPYLALRPDLADGAEFRHVSSAIFVGTAVLWTVLKIPTWLGLLWLMKNCYDDSGNEVGVERSVPN